MIMHLTIRQPLPEQADSLIDALHNFERVIKGQPGVLSAHTLKDPSTGTLISLCVWSTKESWLSGQPAVHRAETDANLPGLDQEPPITYHLEEV